MEVAWTSKTTILHGVTAWKPSIQSDVSPTGFSTKILYKFLVSQFELHDQAHGINISLG